MNMIDFEAFDIGAWTVEGLTRHVKAITQWVTKKRDRNWPAQLTLASTLLVSAGASIIDATTATAASGAPPIASGRAIAQLLQQPIGRDLIVGSPYQFWTDLAGEMRSWKPIEEAGDPEIPPFI
jgi:hypothetical protein